MTQGPAIRTSSRPKALYSTGTRILGLGVDRRQNVRGQTAPAVFVGSADKCFEQRVRLHRLRFELGVELAPQEPGVIGDLADLDVRAVGGLTGDAKASGLEPVFVLAVELVAVAVPLVDLAGAIGAVGEAVLRQAARPSPEPHGSTQLVDAFQFAQLKDDAVRR